MARRRVRTREQRPGRRDRRLDCAAAGRRRGSGVAAGRAAASRRAAVSDAAAENLLIAVLVPAAVTPLVLSRIDTHFLPVLVADYLAVHLFVYGALSLGLLFWSGVRDRSRGVAQRVRARRLRHRRFRRRARSLRRLLHAQSARLPIIAAIAVGAVPYMLADSLVDRQRPRVVLQGFHRARRFPRVAGRGRGAGFQAAVFPGRSSSQSSFCSSSFSVSWGDGSVAARCLRPRSASDWASSWRGRSASRFRCSRRAENRAASKDGVVSALDRDLALDQARIEIE